MIYRWNILNTNLGSSSMKGLLNIYTCLGDPCSLSSHYILCLIDENTFALFFHLFNVHAESFHFNSRTTKINLGCLHVTAFFNFSFVLWSLLGKEPLQCEQEGTWARDAWLRQVIFNFLNAHFNQLDFFSFFCVSSS